MIGCQMQRKLTGIQRLPGSGAKFACVRQIHQTPEIVIVDISADQVGAKQARELRNECDCCVVALNCAAAAAALS